MAIALNLLALALVVGISWGGMILLARRVHRRDLDEEWVITRIDEGDPCPECRGMGATSRLGRLEICPLCEGTGVVSSLH